MRKSLAFLFVLGSLWVLPATADDDIRIEELPQAVRAAIEQRFPGAELLRAERDRDDGRIEYEVDIRHDGKRYEVELLEDGRITDIDEDD